MKPLRAKAGNAVKMPAVCAKSFFARMAARRRQTRRAGAMAAATFCLMLALAVSFVSAQTGFAVYFNGEHIGRAKSAEDVSAVVTDAERELREIFGREYALSDAVAVYPDIGAGADDAEEIKEALLGEVGGVRKLYVLEVDGRAVGASESRETLESILNGILGMYSADGETARFVEDVAISWRFINEDIVRDPSEIRAMIDPENESAPFRLTVETTRQEQRAVEIPFGVRYVDDSALCIGSTEVRAEGSPGEKLVTESVVSINGVERSRKVVGSTVLKEVVDEVVAVGTAMRPLTASYGRYIWPAEGVVTSGFGPRTGFGSSNHQGIDIAGRYGEDIVAADGGEVVMAGWYEGYGLLVQIRHDNGDVTYYGHCSKILVGEGERVYQGQVIARMGATGEANGVHCHFEIRKDGEPVNPEKYLP